jgi:hypothetical protein
MGKIAAVDTTGLIRFDVKPLGPIQEYVVMLKGPPVRVNGDPTHSGPLFTAVATGDGFTITVVVAIALHPRLLVTVRV